jgi:biopolymer transport protein ExbD
MNEDYLWNKIGEDEEIERLENALKAFRQKEAAAPTLPIKVAAKKHFSLPVFRFAVPLAACLALAAIGLGIWLHISQNRTYNEQTSAAVETPQTDYQTDKPAIKEQDELPNRVAIVSKQSVRKQKLPKVKSSVSKIEVQSKIAARSSKSANDAVKLTKEEKYAYDQLMLALSITSAKLNIVKNKVKGIEEPETLPKENR